MAYPLQHVVSQPLGLPAGLAARTSTSLHSGGRHRQPQTRASSIPRRRRGETLHPAVRYGTPSSRQCRGAKASFATGLLFATVWQRSSKRQRIGLRAVPREPQVLSFVDPETGSDVVLVGCMHYNPKSITKTTEVTEKLAKEGKLGAVVLEQCATRWDRLERLQPPGSPLRILLDNEMQAAADSARASGTPIVLGDQDIDQFGKSAREMAKRAVQDLCSPLNGWIATAEDIITGLLQLVNVRLQQRASRLADGIGLQDFFDFQLIMGTPVATFRYFFAIALRSPFFLLVLAGYFSLFEIGSADPILDFLLGVLSFTLQVILVRVLLGPTLRRRDEVLAESISRAAKESAGPGRAVVAVLGAAHCNGVAQLMLERQGRSAKLEAQQTP